MELYQRSKTWWCTFEVDGKRHRVSTKQKTKTAAKTVADRIFQSAQTNGGFVRHRVAQMPTLLTYSPTFQAYIAATQLDSDTKRYYANGARLLASTPLAGKRLDAIASSDCETITFPGSGSNANCALRTLRRLLSYAADQRIIAAAPRVHLRKENEREAVISPELEQDILHFATQPFLDAFILMMDSGLRPDEVIRMRWDDVLWDANLYFNRFGKTKKSRRHVPLSRRAKDALRVRVQGATSPWVFPSVRRRKDGERSHIRAFGLSKEWTRLRALLAITKEIVPYSARHTFGTDLMDQVRGNIVLVSNVMGHADMKVTRRYIHPSQQGLHELIDDRNTRKKEGHSLGHNALPESPVN